MANIFNEEELPNLCRNSTCLKVQLSQSISALQNTLYCQNDRAKAFEIMDKMAAKRKDNHLQDELTHISKELSAIKREKINELSRQRQLHDNSQKLRLLNAQIRSAYVTKEVVGQKDGHVKTLEDARQNRKKEIAEWRSICKKEEESLAKEEEEQRQKKLKLMKALKEQITELEQRRNEEKQANLNEAKEIQRKLKIMELEDQKEKERLQRLQQKLKKDMEENIQYLIEKKNLHNLEQKNYHEQLMLYQKERDERNAKLENERQRIRQRRQILSERMGNELLKKRKEKEEHHHFLIDLLIEERCTKEDVVVRNEMAKKNEENLAMRNYYQHYFHVTKPQKEAKLREENIAAFHMQVNNFAKLDEALKIRDAEKRQKNIEGFKSLKKFIEMKRQDIAQEKRREQLEDEALLNADKAYDKMIHLEAQRLLKSQPPEILNFIPKKL